MSYAGQFCLYVGRGAVVCRETVSVSVTVCEPSGLVSLAMTKLTAKTCLHGLPRSSKSLQVQVGLSPSVVTRYLPVPVWEGTYHNSPSWVIRQRAAMVRPLWRRASVGSMDRAS